MLITIPTECYNDCRHCRPWLLRIMAWPTGRLSPTSSEAGTWISDGPGRAGRLEIKAQPGDLLRHEQRDNHCPEKSLEAWYVVKPDGGLDKLAGKGTAWEYWRSHLASESDTSDQLDPPVVPTDLLVAELSHRQETTP